MPALSKASMVSNMASYSKSRMWLLARERASIPAALRTFTFLESALKWKGFGVRDQGTPLSEMTHSRLQTLRSAPLKTGSVSPHGYSGGLLRRALLTSLPSITSPTNSIFMLDYFIV